MTYYNPESLKPEEYYKSEPLQPRIFKMRNTRNLHAESSKPGILKVRIPKIRNTKRRSHLSNLEYCSCHIKISFFSYKYLSSSNILKLVERYSDAYDYIYLTCLEQDFTKNSTNMKIIHLVQCGCVNSCELLHKGAEKTHVSWFIRVRWKHMS